MANFLMRDLACATPGCSGHETDVFARKRNDGMVEVRDESGSPIEATCNICRGRLEFTISTIKLGGLRKKGGFDARPGMAKVEEVTGLLEGVNRELKEAKEKWRGLPGSDILFGS